MDPTDSVLMRLTCIDNIVGSVFQMKLKMDVPINFLAKSAGKALREKSKEPVFII